ncbi:MAG: WXG100 family type VII secretion target [Limisphaerales bacterium]
MSQAIMDPAEVRRFAEELKRFNLETQNRMSLLHARFSALGDTWQDQEHARFAEEFQSAIKALARFLDLSNQHVPYLLRKAGRIEDYLTQR